MRGASGQQFEEDYPYLAGAVGPQTRFCMISNNALGFWWGHLSDFTLRNEQIYHWHRTFPYDEAAEMDGVYSVGTLRVTVAPDKSSLKFASEAFAPTIERVISHADIEALGLSMKIRTVYPTRGNFMHSAIHPIWTRY